MASSDFAECFADMENWEGWHKFSDDPYDPGGATYCGITQVTYAAWRRVQKLSPRAVRMASDDEIKQIYLSEYWNGIRGDELYPGLDLEMFDIGVNSSQVRAIKFLQTALHIPVDGVFGVQTMDALNNAIKAGHGLALIDDIADTRMSWWHALTTWWRFGKGWTNRGNDIHSRARQMYLNAHLT